MYNSFALSVVAAVEPETLVGGECENVSVVPVIRIEGTSEEVGGTEVISLDAKAFLSSDKMM